MLLMILTMKIASPLQGNYPKTGISIEKPAAYPVGFIIGIRSMVSLADHNPNSRHVKHERRNGPAPREVVISCLS